MIAIHKKFSPLNPTNINWNGTSKLSTVVLFIKVSEAKWERFVRHMSISFCVEVTEFLKKIFRVVPSESFTIENPRIECFGVLYQWAFVVITLILVVDMTKYLATLHFKTCHDLFIKNQNSKWKLYYWKWKWKLYYWKPSYWMFWCAVSVSIRSHYFDSRRRHDKIPSNTSLQDMSWFIHKKPKLKISLRNNKSERLFPQSLLFQT